MKVIIYNQDSGMGQKVPAVMVPTDEALLDHTLMEVAIKDVPAGKPFKIVDASELPQDIPQEYWVIDDSELTDGVGGESNEFEPKPESELETEVQNED